MTDIDSAKIQLKKLAARALVRKEKLEAELKPLTEKRAEVKRDLDAVIDAGRDDLGLELTQILQELDTEITSKSEEIALAEQDMKNAMSERKDLDQAGSDLERAELRAVVDGATHQPAFAESATDRALENVRGHIDAVSAEVELNRELAGQTRSPADDARLEREIAKAKAKAELERLKAARKHPDTQPDSPADAPTDDRGSDASAENDPPKKKKNNRTM